MKKLFLGIVLSTVLLMTACGNGDSENMKIVDSVLSINNSLPIYVSIAIFI